MGTYKENDNTREPINEFINILKEMGKSSSTYKKYAKKTVEEVVKEIEKPALQVLIWCMQI